MNFNLEEKVRINYPTATKLHNRVGVIKRFENSKCGKQYVVELINSDEKLIRYKFFESRLVKYTTDDLMRQCLFENADALDCTIGTETWTYVPNYGSKLIAADGIVNMNFKESEETKMKEIKNQKVVDLYYDRKEKELKDAMNADIETARNNDLHQKFVTDLKKSFDKYVKDHSLELKSEVNFDVSLPYTDERIETVEKIREQGLDSIAKIYSEKKEVLAMLSGCETYEQEMAILRSYGIVGKDNKLVGQTN